MMMRRVRSLRSEGIELRIPAARRGWACAIHFWIDGHVTDSQSDSIVHKHLGAGIPRSGQLEGSNYTEKRRWRIKELARGCSPAVSRFSVPENGHDSSGDNIGDAVHRH